MIAYVVKAYYLQILSEIFTGFNLCLLIISNAPGITFINMQFSILSTSPENKNGFLQFLYVSQYC